jgi:mono/diheme cytochrome c family protein
MTIRKVEMSVVVMISVLILSGGVAYSGVFGSAGKHMPAGGWTDPKAIAEGAKIFTGEANPLVNCASCHGKDGKPVKKGARDLRDPNNTTRFSDSFWFWRVSEGVPKTKMKAWKQFLSEEQIWQVMAYEHQFSHGFKPAEHTDYKP